MPNSRGLGISYTGNQPQGDVYDVGEASYHRFLAGSSLTQTSQTIWFSYFTAQKTEDVTTCSVETTGTAAAATPTKIQFGVWTANNAGDGLSLVASTPHDATLLASTNTRYSKAFSAGFTKQAGQRYAVGLLVVTGAAAPTVLATLASGSSLTGHRTALTTSPRLVGRLTAQATLPASWVVASLTTADGAPFFEIQ